jgi:8-oxo-dGTP diphosphatase
MTSTFGDREPGRLYVDRTAAYVVVRKDNGIAAVCHKGKCFLPGGECEEGETPELTLKREAREELGVQLRIIESLGEAVQYFYSSDAGRHFKTHASFFRGEFGGPSGEKGKYEVSWIPLDEIEKKFFHEFQIWAVRKALSE